MWPASSPEALARAPASREAHGIIIGGSLFGAETEYQRELKERAHALDLTNRVTFTGFVSDDEVAGFLAAAQLVVHPARHEDFGLTVAEAQALGAPVLAYSEVGPAVILQHNQTGWLVPVGDVIQLGETLNEVLASPARLTQAGQTGRERVQRIFSAEEHACRTMQEYRAALAAQK